MVGGGPPELRGGQPPITVHYTKPDAYGLDAYLVLIIGVDRLIVINVCYAVITNQRTAYIYRDRPLHPVRKIQARSRHFTSKCLVTYRPRA